MKKIHSVIIAAMLLAAGQARAIAQHGLVDGINLVYSGLLSLTGGYGYVDGNAFSLPVVPNPPYNQFTPYLTVGSSPLAINTAYYCYVVWGNIPVVGTPFTPDNVTFACSSTVGPTYDGHPKSALVGPSIGDGGAIFTSTTEALFVGSVVTDPTATPAAFIPFYRNGQQVLLDLATPPAPVQPVAPAGFNNETPYDPGVGTATFLTYLSTGAYPDTQNFIPAPFPVLSASAAVLDIHGYNYSFNGVRVCALDPASPTITVAAGIATEACQGQFYINPEVGQFVVLPDSGILDQNSDPSIHTYRANLNFDKSAGNVGKIYLGIASAPANPGEVVLGPVYRGYLEPIKQLFGR